MAVDFTKKIFSDTYRDDFRDSDNYHRILFNSGRALQARELTQMQTIIQREIETFAQNIFKEGAAVNPGGITINKEYEFIKLDTSVNIFRTDPNDYNNIEFTGATSGVKAVVIEAVAATSVDPATLYLRYTKTSTGTSSTSPIRFTPGEEISGGGFTLTVQTTNTVANASSGMGTRASVNTGSFFVQGHFVFFEDQSIILSKYNNTVTATVGFKVIQDIVKASDNDALYDNQGALPNKAAAGADRYRIRLELIDKANVDSDENFVFYANVVNGAVSEFANGTNQYAKIADYVSQRSYETNGNFSAKQFRVKFDENDSDNTKLDVDISAGVAYVNGYRAESMIPKTITIDKAQETTDLNNQVVAANFGNFVELDSTNDPRLEVMFKRIPNLNAYQSRNLRDSANHLGTTIGTARARYIEEDGADYKFYLFDISMNSGKSFRDVKSIGGSTSDYVNVRQTRGETELKGAINNNLLFPLPNSRPKQITDISLEVQRYFTGQFDFSGSETLTLTASGENFSSPSEWIFTLDSSGKLLTNNDVTITGTGTATINISGGPTSTNFEVLTKVDKSQGTVRSKTLNSPPTTGPKGLATNGTFIRTTLDSDGTGAGVLALNLGKPDLFKVVLVADGDSDGADISSRFIVDNGQRDNFYEPARLILKQGAAEPAGNVFCSFSYFTHGASGDFFAVNSYTGQVDYADIPNHELANGTIVNLRDVLDFRPRSTDNGADFAGGTARINELPKPNSLIRFDQETYMPRYDKLIIKETGLIEIIPGQSDLSPRFPETPENSLELYKLKLNPFTLNDSDTDTDLIETKVFTMADIGKLETRIDQLEEIATLNALETNLRTFSVFDSTGADRTKAGFLVDNFSDQLASAVNSPEYAAAIDPREGIVRPSFNEDQIGFVYDSDKSTNTIKKGDNVYIKYDDLKFIDQPLYSGTINVNPFAVITHTGRVLLSPQSDDWREVKRVPPRIVDGGFRLNPAQQNLWNNWEWQWGGTDLSNLAGRQLGRSVSTGSSQSGRTITTTTTTSVTRIVQGETIREVIGDRVLDVAVIPFMRSRKIYFKAEGLKPETRLFPYFDEKDISQWVREETFQRTSDDPTQFGSRHNNATEHPEGKSTLITDETGKIEGSFFLPNGVQKFRTGRREFMLLDITVPKPADSTSRAFASYEANGILETRQQTIRSTRSLNIRTDTRTARSVRRIPDPPDDGRGGGDGDGGGGGDPIAQTFYVPRPDGIFCTKVGVRFASKDPVVPVQLELRPAVEGAPAAYQVLPGGIVFKDPADVNISADGTAITYFEFDEPIYLNSYTEYAFVLKAETIEYNVYIGKTGEFILGSTERRITQQPTLGSFFKSQNSFIWEPDQTIDMAFELHTAKFRHSTAEAILENADPSINLLTTDPIDVTSGSPAATVFHPDHGFTDGDQVMITGLDSSTRYAGILGSSIMGIRSVDSADNDFFKVDFDSNATNSEIIGNNLVAMSKQQLFEQVVPAIDTLVPTSTRITPTGRFTTGRSIAGNETKYTKATTYLTLAGRENNYFNVPQIIPSKEQRVTNLGLEKAITLKLNMLSQSADVSPVIDMQRASMWTIHNRIDFQSQYGDSSDRNNPITYVDETNTQNGTSLAKHITRPVTLENDAIGLKILLAANRPSTSNFRVYYKAVGEDILFSDTVWTEVIKEVDQPTDENPSIFRDYEYLVGGEDGLSTPFSKFMLKIVMNTSNNALVPQFTDLRVIALSA